MFRGSAHDESVEEQRVRIKTSNEGNNHSNFPRKNDFRIKLKNVYLFGHKLKVNWKVTRESREWF
jgi:hypothetical protein